MLNKWVGGIRFGVSMDNQKLKKDSKQAQGMVGKFVATSKKMFKGFAIAAAGATAAFGVMVKQQLAAVDSLAKVSSKLGLATGRLAGLRHAAKQTGIAGATLDMALQRMVRRISEANVGLGEAQDAIKELGLSAQELNRLAPDMQFARIADALRSVENPADKLRLAFKLFDSEGAALVNTLALGSTGLERMHREAKALGLAISQADAKEIEAANDAIDRMMKVLTGFARMMASEIAPMIIGSIQPILSLKEPNALKSGMRPGGLGNRNEGAFSETIRGFQLGHGARDAPAGLWFSDRGPRSTGPGRANQYNQRTLLPPPPHASAPAMRDERLGRELLEGVARGISGGLASLQSGAGRGMLGMLDLQRQGTIAQNHLQRSQTRDSLMKRRDELMSRSSGSRGSLSLTEAGSAESFRQRARIRNQAKAEQLDKQRNRTLKDIEAALSANPLVIAEAGLGG